MYSSKVLSKLRDGEVVRCTKVNLPSADVVEIAGLASFDCVWLDMEHVPLNYSTLNEMVRAAKLHKMDSLVRVSRGSYSDYIKPLEMDATGIMVPHIENVDDAKHVIQMARFHPIGMRALDGGSRDGDYAMTELTKYVKVANKERFVVVQIEGPKALEQIEGICELEGIDMVFFGAGDFSQAIGAPGHWDHPEIIQAREHIAKVASVYGKFAAIPGSADNFNELVDLGYQFITMGADVFGLRQYYDKILAETGSSSALGSMSQYK